MCLWISQAPQQVSCENLASWYQSREHASSEQPAKCHVIPTSESPAVKTPNLLDPRMTLFLFSAQGGSYMMYLLAILCNVVQFCIQSSVEFPCKRNLFDVKFFSCSVPRENLETQVWLTMYKSTLKMKTLYLKFTRSQFKHVGISGKMASKTLMCLSVNRLVIKLSKCPVSMIVII